MHIRFNFKLEGDEILSQNVLTVESDIGLLQDLHRIVLTSLIMRTIEFMHYAPQQKQKLLLGFNAL